MMISDLAYTEHWLRSPSSSGGRLPICCMVVVAGALLGGSVDARAGEHPPYQERWRSLFWQKPPNLVGDDSELVEMSLYRSVPGVSPLVAAVASVVTETCHVDALTGTLTLDLVLTRAGQLKGEPLTAGEGEKLARFYQELVAADPRSRLGRGRAPNALDVTFGMKNVRRLAGTVSNCGSVREICDAIGRKHAYSIVCEHTKTPSIAVLRKALQMGIPVVASTDQGWHVIYASSGSMIAYNIPAKTSVMRKKAGLTRTSREALKRVDDRPVPPGGLGRDFLIRSHRRDREMGMRITVDFETNAKHMIPNDGSIVIEPLEEGKFEAYFLHSGERSARGLDAEILDALGMQPPRTERPRMTGVKSSDMWNKHFYRKTDLVMGGSRLVEGVCIRSRSPAGEMNAAFATVIYGTAGLKPATCAHTPGRFQQVARERHMGDELAELTDVDRAALDNLAAVARRTCRAPVDALGHWPFWESAQRLQKALGRIPAVDRATTAMARVLGWDCDVEGGEQSSYSKYQEALNKGIPILLADRRTRKWFVCNAYVEEGVKHYLLICSPTALSRPEVRLDRSNFLPESGFWFEEFSESKYIPYFIHNWSDTLKAWDPEIKEILGERSKL